MNVIHLPEQYVVQTMNMLRKHIKKQKKHNEDCSKNEGALRSFLDDIVGPEAESQKLAA